MFVFQSESNLSLKNTLASKRPSPALKLAIVEISLAIIQLRLIYKQSIAAVKRDINLDRRAPLQRFFKFAPLCASRAKKIN